MLKTNGLNKIIINLGSKTKTSRQVLKLFFTNFFSFSLLLNVYLIHNYIFLKFIRVKFLPRKVVARIVGFSSRLFRFTERTLDPRTPGNVCKVDLIELAIKNMTAKKVRSVITIGGVSIGFGAIVFLVSIGYGLQEVVIKRVARLDELKQANVTSHVGSKVKINDETIASIKDLPDVKEILPLIAVVGRVNYQNSVSDMAAYGVTSSYLNSSAIKPVKGKIFESDSLVSSVNTFNTTPQVAGASTTESKAIVNVGDVIKKVELNIVPATWIRVRDKASTGGKLLGYTKRGDGNLFGEEIWGGTYEAEDNAGKSGIDVYKNMLGKWFKAEVPLWEKTTCSEKSVDCVSGEYKKLKADDGSQLKTLGYFAEINTITVSSILSATPAGSVLGDSTVNLSDVQPGEVEAASNVIVENSSTSFEIKDTDQSGWVDIPELSGQTKAPETKRVSLSPDALKEAVVNRAMLKILGITEDEAIGKTFSTTFVVTSNLIPQADGKVESLDINYTIVGVTPDEESPYFYVPFSDLRSMGIVNYSQLKVVSNSTVVLDKVRKQIGAMGFNTQSVADTVEQITQLFGNIRVVLGIMGMIALAVAALGMFNTFTVSLLERTREVGLMKAMGMRSDEVQELFLTESMIMGFWGGILGLAIGFVAGKLLGLIISIFAAFNGAGYIDVSYIPVSFVALILFLSLLVGVGTGIYPAVRARKISALNALRYE